MSAHVDQTPLTLQQKADIERLVARFKSERGALLPLLHAIRDELGYVPDGAVPIIAEGLNLSRADVHGVLTFYHDFRRAPAGRHMVKLCRAEACQARGGVANELAVAERLGVPFGEMRADGEVTLEAIYCLGLCASGPSALVDGVPIANATPDAIIAALSGATPARAKAAVSPQRVYISDDMASIALGADKVEIGRAHV